MVFITLLTGFILSTSSSSTVWSRYEILLVMVGRLVGGLAGGPAGRLAGCLKPKEVKWKIMFYGCIRCIKAQQQKKSMKVLHYVVNCWDKKLYERLLNGWNFKEDFKKLLNPSINKTNDCWICEALTARPLPETSGGVPWCRSPCQPGGPRWEWWRCWRQQSGPILTSGVIAFPPDISDFPRKFAGKTEKQSQRISLVGTCDYTDVRTRPPTDIHKRIFWRSYSDTS